MLMGGHPGGHLKNIVQQRGAMLIAGHFWRMPQSQFIADVRCALFLAEDDDFGSRLEEGPTRDRISLDGGDMRIRKRLGAREDGDHIN